MEGQFFGGTSGLQMTMPKRDFPAIHADKSRLAFYADRENSIEINSTFYKLPQAKTIYKWAADVPFDFRFTFKLWKEITHQRNLLFNIENLGGFMRAIAGANEKRMLIGAISAQPSSHSVSSITGINSNPSCL